MKWFYYSLIVVVSLAWLGQPMPSLLATAAPLSAVANQTGQSSSLAVSTPSVNIQVVAQPVTPTITMAANLGCQSQGGLDLNQPASCFSWVAAPPARNVVIRVQNPPVTDAVTVETPVIVFNPALNSANPILPAIPALPLSLFALAVAFELIRQKFSAKAGLVGRTLAWLSFNSFSPVVLRC